MHAEAEAKSGPTPLVRMEHRCWQPGCRSLFFALHKRDASDRDLDPKVSGHVPQEAGARQACYELGCLPLVETELVADLLAADLDIEAAAAPVVDPAHEFAIHVHVR